MDYAWGRGRERWILASFSIYSRALAFQQRSRDNPLQEIRLLGISEISNDMRDLLGRSEPEARLAVDYFVYRVAKEIGALTAVLGA